MGHQTDKKQGNQTNIGGVWALILTGKKQGNQTNIGGVWAQIPMGYGCGLVTR
jgi:uncharacterized membrane protein YebE (DUF533 family)